jgi:uncharacterized FlaG/YvyC family protein
MAENLLPTVGPVAPIGDNAEAARVARPLGETHAAKFDAALTQAEAKPEVKAELKPEPKTKEQIAAEAPKLVPSQEAYHNVRLHFRVDPKTHEVTVLMVDKASHRVIRSIPPEEIGKLKEGDLVELFA